MVDPRWLLLCKPLRAPLRDGTTVLAAALVRALPPELEVAYLGDSDAPLRPGLDRVIPAAAIGYAPGLRDRARLFTGRYHVLGGRLSALDGVGPEDLSIGKLIERVAQGGIDEVVLAMNATLEGQTTAHYIAERIEGYPVRITQLAHGLPVGGELDYLDEGTLAQALRARRPVA